MSSDQQFNINDDTLIDTTQNIRFDLYTAILYLHLFKHTPLNGKYIQIPYFMPSATMRPNVTYFENINTKHYKCTNLYIFNASHNIILDTTYDAEMVIELRPTTNNSSKLYLCFLLSKTYFSNEPESEIDKIIATSNKPPIHYTTMNIDLNPRIEKKQKKIIYKSGIDTVIIFTKPIPILDIDFSSYKTIPPNLFSLYPVDGTYNIIPENAPQIEGFISERNEEGNEEGYVAKNASRNTSNDNANLLDCQLVDIDDPTGKKTVGKETGVYLMDNAQKANMNQAMIGSAITVSAIAIISSFIMSPIIFSKLISNHITSSSNLTTATVVLCIFLIVLAFTLLFNGMQYDTNEMWTGSFLTLFLGLSAMSISFSRSISDPDTEFGDFTFLPTIQDFYDHIIRKLWNGSRSWLITDGNTPTRFSIFLILYGILIVVLSTVSFTLPNDKKVKANEKKKHGYTKNLINLIMSFGCIYGLLFLLWAFAIVP
jgi:hypothetical protein